MTPRVQGAELTGSVCDLCRLGSPRRPGIRGRGLRGPVPGRFMLSRCTVCDLYYQTPRPDRDVIPSYYPPSYAVYGDDPVVGWLFRLTYWLDARRVAQLIGPRGRVLDVGCGAGGALTALAGAGKWEVCNSSWTRRRHGRRPAVVSTCARGTSSTPILLPDHSTLSVWGTSSSTCVTRSRLCAEPGSCSGPEAPCSERRRTSTAGSSGSSDVLGGTATSPAISRSSAPRRSDVPASKRDLWGPESCLASARWDGVRASRTG